MADAFRFGADITAPGKATSDVLLGSPQELRLTASVLAKTDAGGLVDTSLTFQGGQGIGGLYVLKFSING